MEQELNAQGIAAINRKFQELGETIRRSADGFILRTDFDFSRSIQSAADVTLKYFNSEEFQEALRGSLDDMRLKLEELRENAPEAEQETLDFLIEASDAFSPESPDAEIDISDCAETVLAGVEAARENMTEEQRRDFGEVVPTVKGGRSFLTFDRFVQIAILLLTIYTTIYTYLQNASNAETAKRQMKLAEDVRQIEQAQLENGKAIFDAIGAIYDKLDALHEERNSDSEVAGEDSPQDPHDAQK